MKRDVTRPVSRGIGALVGAASCAVLLTGCFPAEPADGYDYDTADMACAKVEDSTDYLIQIPVTAIDPDGRTEWVTSVDFLDSPDMSVKGYSVLPADAELFQAPAHPPSSLVAELRADDANTALSPDVAEGGVLAVLASRDDRSDGASISGLRVEWSMGEPIYFQNIAEDVDWVQLCQFVG